MSLEPFPMAVILKDSSISSHLNEMTQDPPNIDLLLECEDDKNYALPPHSGTTNGLQLHASNNVSMRISFSSCAASSLSCHYCLCNFLSESHLIQHMQKFHSDDDSDDDDGDDDGDDDQVADEDRIADDGDDDDNYGALEAVTMKRAGEIVKTEVMNPGCVKALVTPPRNGMMTASAHGYTNSPVSSFPSPQASPRSTSIPIILEKAAAEQRNLKRRPVTSEIASNPRLTLTIKRSKSSYEIQKEEDSLVPVSPATQMREENCDVQSDSTNETIDVESSSPYSSPGSGKNEIRTVVNGKKNASPKFFCEECKKSYMTKYALKRHIAIHSDERPYVCTFPDCKGAFKLKSRLTDHIRYVHNRKTPRTVNRSKSEPDTTTSSLAQVLLSPSALPGKPSAKTKLFKCPMPNCTRDFRDAYNLDSHMCLHTGHMPYKCSVCSFSAIQKTSLDWHMQTKHPKSS